MKKIITVLSVAAMFTACMPSEANKANASAAKNQEIMRKFTEEIINKHNLAIIDSLVAPEYVEHDSDPGYTTDRNGLKKAMEEMIKGFPDLSSKINFMMADSDCVTTQYTLTGTNTGTLMGMAATGKKMNVDGVDIVRYKNGKAVEHWGYLNEMKIMSELGVNPNADNKKM